MKNIIYSVCLSTVDRRSRERFIESNNQIASLVERFKLEGGAYRKFAGSPPDGAISDVETHQKVPLTAYGSASAFAIFFTLIKYNKQYFLYKLIFSNMFMY
jgi:ATP-binding cassette subfamily G (WHITE) protein 5 (sterolin 1)